MTEILTEMQPCGQLVGHSGCLTQIANDSKYTDIVLSFSNDISQILWKLTRDDANYDIPQKSLTLDGNNALSDSWDKTFRLWGLAVVESIRSSGKNAKEARRLQCSSLVEIQDKE
ncbi:guanine nucleotide-binding protein subunit beta-2-like 1 [Culex pipiens pallens]|uniref:guanine nucleotide-binding protein subunit beta-2-like 1 n=1 Tax=Culex pipiens pallens TaxID=42434 RepID=UPI0022AA77B2|nr:guanine nucleotide-binding protein subunit beta-2-like 1 [Culex pipiens pallens]